MALKEGLGCFRSGLTSARRRALQYSERVHMASDVDDFVRIFATLLRNPARQSGELMLSRSFFEWRLRSHNPV
jgi:hypothetical protein